MKVTVKKHKIYPDGTKVHINPENVTMCFSDGDGGTVICYDNGKSMMKITDSLRKFCFRMNCHDFFTIPYMFIIALGLVLTMHLVSHFMGAV